MAGQYTNGYATATGPRGGFGGSSDGAGQPQIVQEADGQPFGQSTLIADSNLNARVSLFVSSLRGETKVARVTDHIYM